MNSKEWADRITFLCKQAGTYKTYFEEVINQLASIMETRDKAQEQFEKSGCTPVIRYTNKGGFVNLRKNPELVVMNECNQIALSYWRDLGLTPSGYKRLIGDTIEKHDTTFEEALAKIGV